MQNTQSPCHFTRIPVHAGKPYDALIGRGLLSRAGERLREVHAPCKAALITDETVNALYGDTAARSLQDAGYEVCRFAFPGGEAHKNLDTFAHILAFLAQAEMTRSDCVVALGGGVVGDLAGFSAASYLRGIDFIQLPTTFLAAVDASVGGKTGLNLAAGKNLCGAFHQPRLVLIDCDTFSTLPAERFADGAAEALKTGIIADKALFEQMKTGVDGALDAIVARCVQIKADFVAEDELDNGQRRLLNLGHTFGHAIERCSQYRLTHGHAVAVGMLMAARAAWAQGLSAENCAPAISDALQKNGLPTSAGYSAQALADAMLNDKKRTGGQIAFILPERIGLCKVESIPVSELLSFVTCALEVC